MTDELNDTKHGHSSVLVDPGSWSFMFFDP